MASLKVARMSLAAPFQGSERPRYETMLKDFTDTYHSKIDTTGRGCTLNMPNMLHFEPRRRFRFLQTLGVQGLSKADSFLVDRRPTSPTHAYHDERAAKLLLNR
jgi:hypothetical protein